MRQHDWIYAINPDDRWLRGSAFLWAKRLMDLSILLVFAPMLIPLIGGVALVIKLSSFSDPVFFLQLRTGRGGQRFKMYKFRTMVANAEELKKELTTVNADGELAGPLKLKNDPRVTRIGRVLRRTSLDELPQVLNILRGEMSWVGPRPTSWGLKSYELWHTERLDTVPGLTGLWQLYGRGDTDFDSWLRWDIAYLERQCIWLDFQILVRTVLAVLQRKGAH